MLLHLRPMMLSSGIFVNLIDLRIGPFGLYLRGGRELMTGRPYPNKHYTVVCRKKGKKAMNGILVKVNGPVKGFDYSARWLANGTVVTHRVSCSILDQEFGAASDEMWFWLGTLGEWENRMPERFRGAVPVYVQPVMQLVDSSEKRPSTVDVVDLKTGWIIDRTQVFAMPTIEPERFLSFPQEDQTRMPKLEDAFEACIAERPRHKRLIGNLGSCIQ
jgi:Family of unknown function (DUF6012)